MTILRPALLALTLTLTAGGAAAQTGGEPDAFVPLFNGTDLSGWVNVNCAPETWTVRDGMIHCDGTPTGALRTERPYENFVLELEWRHLTAGGNAGVFIWSSPLPAVGQPFLRAIEVQVLDHGYGTTESYTTDGDVFAIHGASMKPFPPSRGMRSFPSEKRSKESPEWNHYRVTCQDGTIRLAVNGKDVSGGEQCQWRAGFIGLESEGAPVDWRNIRIHELPTTNPAPDDCAPPALAAKLLYDGRSLRGWKCEDAGTPESAWTPDDWQLTCQSAGSALTLDSPFPDTVLHFDLLAPKPGGAPLTDPVLRIQLGGATLGVTPGDGWQRYTLTRSGESLRLESLDGSHKSAASAPADGQPLRFLAAKGTRLANLYQFTKP